MQCFSCLFCMCVRLHYQSSKLPRRCIAAFCDTKIGVEYMSYKTPTGKGLGKGALNLDGPVIQFTTMVRLQKAFAMVRQMGELNQMPF